MTDLLTLAKALISCPSVTPVTAGVFDVIENFLVPLGFVAHRVTFEEAGTAPVENIYLRYGTQGPNFCFAGHTDVVPPGDEAAWRVPPFAPDVIDGELYGRGAEDMKGAIAAFMVAAREFMGGQWPVTRAQKESKEASASHRPPATGHAFNGSISLLITQDEEGIAINGTKKMLGWLAERGEGIDACIVGEPTNPDRIGEMAKVGRRGSITFTLEVVGKQGHVAYPERADNPVTRMVAMLAALKDEPLDGGTEFFPPSNLEITTVDVGNPTVNVIPERATAKFNVRFNDLHSGAEIDRWVRAQLDPHGAYQLQSRISGEAFLTRDVRLADVVVGAVMDVTGMRPALSTTGGTSDARFIKDVCPVIEFGTTGRTPHMVNERVEVATLEALAKIYQRMLERFFLS